MGEEAIARFEKKDGSSPKPNIRDQFRDEFTRGSRWERDPATATRRQEGRLRRRATSDRINAAWSQMSTADVQFLAQILVKAESPVEGRPPQMLQSAVAAFDVYGSSYNWWKVRSWRLFGFPRGADSSIRRREDFDRRFDGGRVTRRRLNRVNASAIAGLLIPPTVNCPSTNVVRSDGIVAPPPAHLPRWQPDAELWPLGTVSNRREQAFLGAVPLDDTLFTLCCGASGCGKTESSLGRILATADAGHSVVFVDPHGTGITRLKDFLGYYHHRVYELSLELGQPEQTAWNPFAITHRDQLEERMASISDALAAAVGWRHGINNRAIGITVNSVRTLLESALILPPGMKPTVFQLGPLLGDEEWRGIVTAHLSQQTKEYWSRFAYGGSEFTPLMSLVDRLRTAESIASLLGASEPTFDLRQAIDRGGIILVRLRGTGDTDKLVAALMVYSVLEALLSRRDIPEDQRRPCHVWVDQAQIVDDAIRQMTAALAEQSRKFGGRLHLMCQAPQRLSTLTLTAMMTNRSHLITSAVDDEGARKFTTQRAGHVNPRTLQRLAKFAFVGQVQLRGSRTDPFKVGSVPIDALWAHRRNDDADTEQLTKSIARNSGYRNVGDTLDALDSLTERIRDHLKPPPPGSRKQHPPDSRDGPRWIGNL